MRQSEYGWIAWKLAAGVILTAGVTLGQTLGDCSVSILNRSSAVGADGRWRVENVPTTQGPVRARFVCTNNGVTQYGQTGFFNIVGGRTNAFPAEIILGNFKVPSSLSITAPATTLNGQGVTTQATATVTYHDATTQNVTVASASTSYFSSNPQIASVSADGLITATGVGSAIITALHDGVSAFLPIEVTRGGDTDNDGIPDASELLLGLLPNNPADALEDPDSDGLTNLDEFRLNADIRNPDTDGDGIQDGIEVRLGLVVTVADATTTVVGRVTDGAGAAVPNAQVSVFNAINTTTDATGNYTLRFVPANLGPLAIQAVLRTPLFRAGSLPNVSAVPGGTTTVPVLVLSGDAGSVTGLVTNAGGQPVANAPLTLQVGILSIGGTTDATGRYRFDGVPAGSISLAGLDGATGARGSAQGVLSANATLTLNLTLSPSGAVTGSVVAADGFTQVPRVQVVLTAGTTSLTTVTDVLGRFRFDGAPVGPFTVDAELAGDRARLSSSLPSAGAVATANLRLAGLGAITVTALQGSNPLLGIAVRVTNSALGITYDANTDANGVASFPRVLAGAFSITGTRTSPNQIRTQTGTLAVNGSSSVTLTFDAGQAGASISGLLLGPGGTAPVPNGSIQLRNTVSNAIAATTASGADGAYRFDAVPLGTFAAEYLNAGRVLAREHFTIATATDALVRNLIVVGTGTVSGTVRNADATPAAGQTVTIRSLERSVGGFFTATTDATGAYSASAVPAGNFNVTVFDSARTLYGEAAGTLAAGATATADVTLQGGTVPLPRNLWDANNRRFDILTDGRVSNGDSQFGTNTFDGAAQLEVVVGSSTARFLGAATARTELTGRQLVIQQTGLNGLQVTRKIFVPRDGYFARYVEVLSNPSAAAITAAVRVGHQMAFPGFGGKLTSSGDADLSVADAANPDRWITWGSPQTFGNVPEPLPARGIAFDGVGAATRAASAIDTGAGVIVTWTGLTIPAGGSVAIMHFLTQHPDHEISRVVLQHLHRLPPEAVEGLTPAEIAQIRNFAVPPDGTSSLAPQVPLTGSFSTTLLDHSGTLPATDARLLFNSNSAFYNRSLSLVPAATGVVTVATNFTANGTSVVIPQTGYRLRVTNPLFSTTAELYESPGAFANGQADTPATLRLTGSGNFSTNFSYPSGAVTRLAGIRINNTNVTTLPAGGPYTFTAVPPGQATFQVGDFHPQSPFARTVAYTATAVAGQTLQLSLHPPMGNISGRVTQAGAPVPNIQVRAAFGNTIRETVTDAQGNYSLFDLEVAEYPLVAQAGSNRSAPQTVAVVAGQTLVRNLELQGTGSVEVRVTTNGGTPVPNAIVRAVEFFSNRTTDASGVARFDSLAIVPTTFEVIHPTFDWIKVAGTVTPATTPPALNLVFPLTGTVTGVITRGNGSLLANSQVGVFCGFRSAIAFSDAQGRYTRDGIPVQQSCTVNAFEPTFTSNARSAPFQLDSGGQTFTQDLRIPAFATLRVTARDQNNQPLVNAAVEIRYVKNGAPVVVNRGSDATGLATFAGVTEGPVSIQVRRNALSPAGPGIATGSATIRPEDDLGTVNVTVTLGAPGTVRGTVFAADGATPVPGAYVDVRDLATGVSVLQPECVECGGGGRTVSTDQNGLFDSGPVVVGSLGFRVGVVEEVIEGTPAMIVSDTGQFTSPNQIVTKNLTLPYSVIRGTVFKSDGVTPLPGVSVFVSQGSEVRFGFTDDLGRYTVFNLPAGPFNVQVQQGGLFKEAPGTLVAANTPVTVNVVMEPGATVRGVVRSAGGQTVSDAQVGIGFRNPSFSAVVATDAVGAYEQQDLPLGSLFIEAQDPVSQLSGATAVTLAAANEIKQADVTLETAGSVLGQAWQSNGTTALSNADVRLESLEIGPLGGVRRYTGADGTGNFSFAGVPAGPVRAIVSDVSNLQQAGLADGNVLGNQVIVLNPALGGVVSGTADLDGASGFRYTFGCGGLLAGGGTTDSRLGDPFLQALGAPGAGCQDVARRSPDGRELTYGPQYSRGLALNRRVFAPANGKFARYVDSFTNTTALAATVELNVTGSYSTWTTTSRLVTDPNSNGRTFAVTDDPAACCTPSVGVVLSGLGGRVSPQNVRFPQTGQPITSDFAYKWTISVPAGQTVSILQFVVQRDRLDTTGAIAQAQALANLSDPDALTGLSAAERSQILNFNVQ